MTRGQAEPILDSMLEDSGVQKIILRRKNRVKTYVSTLIAEATGQWEAYRNEELIAEKPRVNVLVDELQRHLAETLSFYARIESALSRTCQVPLGVEYETLLPSTEHSRLLRFLGIAGTSYPLQARSVKQNAIDLRDLIANYEDVRSALMGTNLESELTSLAP